MDKDYEIRQGEGVPFVIDDVMKAFEDEQRILRDLTPSGPFESIEEWRAWASSIISVQGISQQVKIVIIERYKVLTLQYLSFHLKAPQPVLAHLDRSTWERKCRICGCDWFHPCEGGCWWVEEDLCSTCHEKLSRHWWGRLRLRLHRKRGALG